jgi:hypothetical protein
MFYKKDKNCIDSFAFSHANYAADEADNPATRASHWPSARPNPGGYPYTLPERFREGFIRKEPIRCV